MPAIVATQVTTVKTTGEGEVTEWLRINNVDTGDTIDVASIGGIVYKKVQIAMFFGHAQSTAVIATIAGTVITLTSVGMADDSVELLVMGQA